MHSVPAPPSIVWHRNDLRLADNAAVTAAAKDAPGGVVGAVVLPGEPGAPFTLVRAGGSSASTRAAARADPPRVTQWSPRRLGHLLQAVDGLRAEWHAAGSELFVLRGNPAECIPALVADLNACAVHTAPCPAFDELRENEAVARALGARGAELHVHDETTMIAASDLPFAIGGLPDVFSNFRRRVERECRVRAPLPVPAMRGATDETRALAMARSDATLAAPDLAEARAAADAHDPRSSFACHGT
ncbi:MAG: deoxyribodipyrimidine photo-lyase, partial [Phycisphaerales bacterium]